MKWFEIHLRIHKRRPEEGTGAQYGPGWLVEKGEGFESFRVFELLQDSDDEERQELGRRAMLRTLAPQTTASIVYMMNNGKHPDDKSFAALMRNASAVGFDAILSQPYNNHVGMGPNQTTVERFKALVKLGESLPNPVMLGQYTCLQQMKTINATNKNQCKSHMVVVAGDLGVCQGGVCQRFQACSQRFQI